MRPIKSNDIPINHHVEQGDNQRRNDTIIANSFTRFPCNARGVGGSHTAFNAYFNVPSNCTHGTRFQCSQDDCRKSGRWFRYCLFCNSVTCDRNFNSQHYPRRACWMKKSDPNRNKRPTLERVGVDGESGACSFFIAEQEAENEEDDESRSHDDSSASSNTYILPGHVSQQSPENIWRDKASSSSMAMLPTEGNAVALPRVPTQSTDEEDSFSCRDLVFPTNEHSPVNKTADSIWFHDELPSTTDLSLSTYSICKPSMMVSDTEVTVAWKIHPGTKDDVISRIRQTFPDAVRHNKKRTLSEVDGTPDDSHGEWRLNDQHQSSNVEFFFNDFNIEDIVGTPSV